MSNTIDYQVVKDFELKKNEDGWTITKYVGFDINNIEIPAEIEGKKITAIGERLFALNNVIHKVKVEYGIKRIEDEAFRFSRLSGIELPDSLEVLGNSVFANSKLVELVVPNSVTIIGKELCSSTSLSRLILSDKLTVIPQRAFNDCKKLEFIDLPPQVKKIENSAFLGCEIKQLDLPEGIEILEEKSFAYNRIETVILPKSLKKLDKDALSSVSTIIIPKGCEVELGDGAFGESQKNLYIPSSVTKFGSIFYGKDLYRSDKYKRDENGKVVYDAFGNEKIESEWVSFDVERISPELTIYCEIGSPIMKFAKTRNIKCADYDSNIQRVCADYDSNIQKVTEKLKYSFDETLRRDSRGSGYTKENYMLTIKKDIKIIKAKAIFESFEKLCFEEGSKLEYIEEEAFSCWNYYPNLSSKKAEVVFPSTVKTIEKGAFHRCDFLETVYVPSTCNVEDGAFEPNVKVVYGEKQTTNDIISSVNIENISKAATEVAAELGKVGKEALGKAKGLLSKFKK